MNTCQLCGEPMPIGEQMFKYHGYSGDCPKPPLLSSGTVLSSGAFKTEDDMDPQEEGDEKSTN